MKTLESIEQYQDIIKGDKQTILLFSATWCPDCRVIEPFLPELEEAYNEVQFYYVDRDEFIDLCADLSVFGIPSFVAFKNGEETGRFVSKDRKSREEIETFIQGLSK
ncbi:MULTISPECIES: thioredoxin family protein [Pontibacillus]|uniref:Thioredoxin family protein n=1 Tax=Pontibacillus chungwhensis TaxID=265426 RepID=A0ABY8UXN2_9BACI|nr:MULTISPECIES: thioredoxin family protein [Pontibacillus]MCD5323902.1 thioredoxin family protein [Pontibacillus sp. HN14]WIF97259.1 thioredoxin family protein [Pontibacillus chungwhensis]